MKKIDHVLELLTKHVTGSDRLSRFIVTAVCIAIIGILVAYNAFDWSSKGGPGLTDEEILFFDEGYLLDEKGNFVLPGNTAEGF